MPVETVPNVRTMSPEEYRDCMEAVNWRPSDIAWILGIDVRVTSRWASGARNIPYVVADWLRLLAGFHDAHPLPDEWRNVVDD
jgi:hypothetical protein